MFRKLSILFTGFLFSYISFSQGINNDSNTGSFAIRINQVGYYPEAPKIFIVADALAESFQIKEQNGRTVFSGRLSEPKFWEKSGEKLQTGDFSPLNKTGKYYIELNTHAISYPFEIKLNLYHDLAVFSTRAFYFQRASMPIDKRFAGNYSRPMGHPDTACYFHPSTGHNGGKKASPRGWYDAGDYNKYVVNAGVTLGMLMQLHELFPDYFPDGALNIPENGNRVNDLVDEIRYELDWLLSMQDADGGVFFKVSNLKHDPFAMPDKTLEKRYIIGKSTGSTLCFSAMLAQASRIMKPVNRDYSSYLLQCSERAWNWAVLHPDKVFKNPLEVHTGEYFEEDFHDDFFWAACELYTTTSNPVYYQAYQKYFRQLDYYQGNWRYFLPDLGYFSLLSPQSQLPENEKTIIKKRLYKVADSLLERINIIPYRISVDNFAWGSNSDVLDAAIIFAEAYYFSNEKRYLNAAIENTDYVLGKNGTSYSFVTGFGTHPPKNPHHRISASDGIEEPIPGFLVGGPNSGHNDANNDSWGVIYKFNEPARSYMDVQNSWASNEVAINWNAPLVFITGFLENSMGNEQKQPVKKDNIH